MNKESRASTVDLLGASPTGSLLRYDRRAPTRSISATWNLFVSRLPSELKLSTAPTSGFTSPHVRERARHQAQRQAAQPVRGVPLQTAPKNYPTSDNAAARQRTRVKRRKPMSKRRPKHSKSEAGCSSAGYRSVVNGPGGGNTDTDATYTVWGLFDALAGDAPGAIHRRRK